MIISISFLLFISHVFSLNILPNPRNLQTGTLKIQIPKCKIKFNNQNLLNLPNSYLKILETHKKSLFGDPASCDKNDENSSDFIINLSKLNSDSHSSNEYYELLINENQILIQFLHEFGLVHAISTLIQILRNSENEQTEKSIILTQIPIKIYDFPRFEFRSLMVDPSRHFLLPETLKRVIYSMMLSKLNILHIHFSDDDSVTMQSKNIPGLAENSSFSMNEIYSVQTIKDLIDYGLQHAVRIIPEIDMPGHSRSIGLFKPLNSLLTCFDTIFPYYMTYFEYRIHGGPGTAALDPTLDETYDYAEKMIKDLIEYFPDDYIHLGGDEVITRCWDQRNTIHEFMKKNNISDYYELQTYYISRVRKSLAKLNSTKRAIYWSNIATFPIKYDPNDIIGYWGESKYISNLTEIYPNNKYIIGPYDYAYLDCGVGNRYGAVSWCGEYKTWLKMYMFEPTNYTIPAEKILGSEACAWGEMNTDFNIDLRLWPRMAAFAENLWSAKPQKTENIDLKGLVKRLVEFNKLLASFNIPSNSVSSQYCEIHIDECFGKIIEN